MLRFENLLNKFAYNLLSFPTLKTMLLSLNPSTEQFKNFIHTLPYSVLLAFPLKNEEDDVIDFELNLFNRRAEQDFPSLRYWYPGATLWTLMSEEAINGLFSLYKKALISNTVQKTAYFSSITQSWRPHLIQPFSGGVLALGKGRKKASGSTDFDLKIAQYRAAMYELYGAFL